ncbi:MAG TPA: hypothetical protein VGY56_14015 [Verrucomicrobiae bacterium]|nr:hypothetical protein [Verrucomicrobiae bacterium]
MGSADSVIVGRGKLHFFTVTLSAMQVANPDIAFLVFKMISRFGSLKIEAL